jgi:hypothetical protein
VDGPARLDVRLGGKESRLVGKLATVEGGRSRAAEGRGDLADGQLGQEAVGEAAYEQRQPGRLGHEDLGQRRPLRGFSEDRVVHLPGGLQVR